MCRKKRDTEMGVGGAEVAALEHRDNVVARGVTPGHGGQWHYTSRPMNIDQ